MKIEQIYTSCLSEAAYYIESEGKVAIIDPLRETQQYIEKAKKNNSVIKYVFETHFHADFVSGHIDLAKKTGAKIVFGPKAKTNYQSYIAKDGEEFHLGKVKIRAIHTPGHTLESTTYLLFDENGKEYAIFTGDTLFLGDVGRPDLAIKSDLTKEDLAGILYDSLRNKIMPLPDHLIVYPAHGAGSACGKNLSKETIGNLGEQKQTNYALRTNMKKEEFVKELLDGILPPPQYFEKNAALNKYGYENFEKILTKSNVPLNPIEFQKEIKENNVLLLDVRHQDEYVKEHIPGSLFIGIKGGFAPWVGALIKDIKQSILLVTPEGKEEETITRLSRVGYDNVLGYLEGGIHAWKSKGFKTEKIESITAQEFEKRTIKEDDFVVLDVRKSGEWKSEHLEIAKHFPLDYINDSINNLNNKDHYYIHCAGGYRSVIFASILKSKGMDKITDIKGGYGAIKTTKLKRTNFVCPSTL